MNRSTAGPALCHMGDTGTGPHCPKALTVFQGGNTAPGANAGGKGGGGGGNAAPLGREMVAGEGREPPFSLYCILISTF